MTGPDRATLPHSPRANRGRVAKFLRLVMIEHSVFALPFAYISALTAMWQLTRSVHWWELVLITIAMVSARTVAMAANRILDTTTVAELVERQQSREQRVMYYI